MAEVKFTTDPVTGKITVVDTPLARYMLGQAPGPGPTPSATTQTLINGVVTGSPITDALGRVWTLTAGPPPDVLLNGFGNWTATNAGDPPTELLLGSDGQVYMLPAIGIWKHFDSDGTWRNGTPPAPVTPPGPPPPLPPLPTPSAIAPGSSGIVIACGAGQAIATLSAAIPTAKAGDKIVVSPGTYTDTPPAWSVPLLIDLGGASFDATGMTATLARGKSLLCPAADSIIQNGIITGVAMDQTSGQLTSAIRPDFGCGYLTIKNMQLHGNQCGVGHGGFPIVIEIDDSDISGNGLLPGTNTGSLTHNLYVGAECVKLTLTNVISTNPAEAHAIKYRGPQLIISGGTFASAPGKPFDLPNGSSVPFTINGAAILKGANDPDHGIMGYGEEGATNGLAGGTITKGSITANCPNPVFRGPGGTITLSGVTETGNAITAVDGLTLVRTA